MPTQRGAGHLTGALCTEAPLPADAMSATLCTEAPVPADAVSGFGLVSSVNQIAVLSFRTREADLLLNVKATFQTGDKSRHTVSGGVILIFKFSHMCYKDINSTLQSNR